MPSAKRGCDGQIISSKSHQLASSTIMPAMPVSRFSKLPIELNLQILEHRLIFSRPITRMAHTVHAKNVLVPLAQTNKELYNPEIEMYYSKNEFVAQVTKNGHAMCLYTFKYTKSVVGQWLRKLTVKLCFSSTFNKEGSGPPVGRVVRAIFTHHCALIHLLRSNGSSKSKSFNVRLSRDNLRWQELIELQVLKIVLILQDELCFMKYPGRWSGYTPEECQDKAS